MQSIWCLDYMNKDRGGTLLLPSSHLIGHGPNPTKDEDWERFSKGAVAVEAEAGDVLLYVGQSWHAVNANKLATAGQPDYPGGKNGVRACVLGQWLPSYFTAMEDHQWRTPAHVVERMSPLSRKLMGFTHVNMPGSQSPKWKPARKAGL